ncbi:flippase [Budviciaceae bacterium CWB-B4]|uniref:Flippase n=1 Tax=Limnobaculum xujianqingii TaxID=2738837 RepID=A0A9D7AL32_9GAMM|nr:flippase [Limnobaculum xujianqingii]MBK5074425.1 flippase [Limnobaculum xujianqingii]MBK5177909.1 flippase [Limnobaculum xujianqingii]
MKISGLNKNILYLALVQGSGYILPLLTFPYLVRILGPELFGVLGFCQASIQYLVLITDYGFNLSATQQVAKFKNDKIELARIFWSVIWSKLFLSIIAFFILFIVCFFVEKYNAYWFVLIAFTPLIFGNIIYPIWLFQGMEKMKWISICSILSRFLLIPFTFIFVQSPGDIWLAALIQGSVNLIAGLLSVYLIIKYNWIEGFFFEIQYIKKCLFDGWHVFISTSAISLYTISTVVILGFISNPASVGYFNAANTIRNAVQSVITPINQAIYPRINALYSNDYDNVLSLIRKTLLIVGSVSLFFSIILFVFTDLIVVYGLGEQYKNSISVLRWMSFLPFIVGLSSVFGVQILLTHGYKKQFSAILLISGAINVIIIFPLSMVYSADGAAISILITELFVTISMFLFLKSRKILF